MRPATVGGRGRTPTRASAPAAEGRFCAIIAMPNNDPVVDNASVISCCADARARRGTDAFAGGLTEAIMRGQAGEQLTERELARGQAEV